MLVLACEVMEEVVVVMDIVVREVYVFVNHILFKLNLYLLSHILAQLF